MFLGHIFKRAENNVFKFYIFHFLTASLEVFEEDFALQKS